MSASAIDVGHNQAQDAFALLSRLALQGGPNPEEYGILSDAFQLFDRLGIPFVHVRQRLKPTLESTNCIMGLGFLKPHGYAGDFEIMDRIYTSWLSPDPQLQRWDKYLHAQVAMRAVRNRKTYFHRTLDRHSSENNGNDMWVLNLASGPARDVYEYQQRHKSGATHFHCVDFDERAIEYGRNLCSMFLDRMEFSNQNILRLKCTRQYDLVWSGGLFDYFSDRIFRSVLKRALAVTKPGGEIVIGNFSEVNPSRFIMEAVVDWRVIHRSEHALTQLALSIGIPRRCVFVDSEPEGVNLFLHVRRTL